MSRFSLISLLAFSAWMMPSVSHADSANLVLSVNGKAIQGESTKISLGRANTIECLSVAGLDFNAPFTSAGQPAGAATAGPIECVKRIDKASALLFKTLTDRSLATATLTLYRTSAMGAEEAYVTIAFTGYISGLSNWIPATANAPAQERVRFTVRTMTFTYVVGAMTHTWSAS